MKTENEYHQEQQRRLERLAHIQKRMRRDVYRMSQLKQAINKAEQRWNKTAVQLESTIR